MSRAFAPAALAVLVSDGRREPCRVGNERLMMPSGRMVVRVRLTVTRKAFWVFESRLESR